jgi:hypothetical protein
MSLITGNKVKKTHKPRYCEKEKDNFVDQKMYFRDCKTLSVFERKIPLTFRVKISPRVKTKNTQAKVL